MFAELTEHYVTAMNSKAVPTISTAWERVLDGEIRRVEEEAGAQFERFLQEQIRSKLPLETIEIKPLLRQAKKKGTTVLNSLTIANAPPEKLVKLREVFDDKMEEALENIEQQNWYASDKDCEQLFHTLH